MTDANLPTVRIAAHADKIEITLPPADQSIVPTIPAELRDRDIPAFVVEWLLESEEIATIVQELLQAPTKSLCRAHYIPEINLRRTPGANPLAGRDQPFASISPTPKVLSTGMFEVAGFQGEPAVVPSLPEGVQLPYQVLQIVVMARKVDAWLTKGQRVLEWSAEQGVPDASWLPATAS